MDRSIVLGGMKHCGKSTTGKRLAAVLNADFTDTDDLLSAGYFALYGEKLTPREIFRTRGEEFFRRMEGELISRLAEDAPEKRIIALGGGVPANPFVKTEDLRRLGTFVYLKIDSTTAFKRVAAGGLPPFIRDEKDFEALYSVRNEFYLKYADIVLEIEGDEPPESIEARLLERIYE